jgi:hypothetical protein
MSHEHDHDANTYFVDQLCTVSTCSAFGIVMILLWYFGKLDILLVSQFHPFVLWGGIGVLALVALRALSLWSTSRARRAAAQPEQVQGHIACGCDHGDGQAHAGKPPTSCADHGHAHFAPWRYAVLLLPIMLYLMNPGPEAKAEEEPLADNVVALSFNEFLQAAYSPQSREPWTTGDLRDNEVRLTAMLDSSQGPALHVFRLARGCCIADSYRVYALVLRPKDQPPAGYSHKQWLRIVGKLVFLETEPGRYLSVLEAHKVEPIPPQPYPYVDRT